MICFRMRLGAIRATFFFGNVFSDAFWDFFSALFVVRGCHKEKKREN